MSGFADYRKPRLRKGGTCAYCDGPGQGRVAVTLMERKVNPERTTAQANRVTFPAISSHSRTLCESCAVRIYDAAVAVLVEREAI